MQCRGRMAGLDGSDQKIKTIDNPSNFYFEPTSTSILLNIPFLASIKISECVHHSFRQCSACFK